ncbi:MAG: 4-alpha-glucanotransferase [Nitrospinae bacterium]|nr:4-alpha-glucanotransferase [Nitrospinota bacterium]
MVFRMNQANPFHARKSGILLHPTSLPSETGFGDLGPRAFEFVDQLAASGQSWWQMLPVCPTDDTGSPYVSSSTFAGNPLLISLASLAEEGLLSPKDLENNRLPDDGDIEPAQALQAQESLLAETFEAFSSGGGANEAAYTEFCESQAGWLTDYARFRALKRAFGGSAWWEWPEDSGHKDPDDPAFDKNIRYTQFEQFIFHRQWRALKEYAAAKGVGLIGDIPIYVAHDSADVWARTHLFELDGSRRPTAFAGAPPDYFNQDGQHWGNPLYDWAEHFDENFAWWKMRMAVNVTRFNALRMDHFIGFARFWVIPADAESPKDGAWREGPGEAFFSALEEELGALPLIAEDLGSVGDDVHALRDRFRLPSMRVLQFAFDGSPDNPHLPHNIPENAVVYTGTHDNDTAQGWFHGGDPILRNETPAGFAISRASALRTFGGEPEDIHWSMIRAAMKSQAALAIIPAQDVLGLGNEGRMNRPGVPEGNWTWRMCEGAWNGEIEARLLSMTQKSGRAPE